MSHLTMMLRLFKPSYLLFSIGHQRCWSIFFNFKLTFQWYVGFCLFIQRSLGRFISAGNRVDRVHLSCVLTAWGAPSEATSSVTSTRKHPPKLGHWVTSRNTAGGNSFLCTQVKEIWVRTCCSVCASDSKTTTLCRKAMLTKRSWSGGQIIAET